MANRCDFGADDSCGFVDSSVNTSRWVIASNRSEYDTSGSCKTTHDNDYPYTGNVSHTVSGRICQRWDAQSPHQHHQSMADFFPDPTLNDSADFCRNPNNPFIPRTAWCYTTDEYQRREYCDVPHCLDYFMRAEFPHRISGRAILMSPLLAPRASSPSSSSSSSSSSCLRFRYHLTSTRVQLTVIVASDADDSQQTFAVESEPTAVVWLTGELGLKPDARRIHFCADKMDVTDSTAYVLIDNVTITEERCRGSEVDNTSLSSDRVPYLGQRLSYETYMQLVLEDMKATNMSSLTSTLAHQMEQLIHECDFVVNDCLAIDSFKTELTDMGQCYTFNYNASNIYNANAPGAKSGLRLTLNIEQYEHVPEFGVGVGVKMFLHDQNEVPSMRNLGLSIPTSMHTLASAMYTRTDSIEPPSGKCGTSNLTYYASGETYTEAKCLLQDKTDYYVSQCGCKDIYMPGPLPVCNFTSYFECVYTTIQDHLVSYTSVCPPACTINSFTMEMSQAQMPGLDINKLYAGKADDIESRYLRALEVRHRVDDSLLTTILSQLQAAIDATTLLKDYVYFGALDPATSFPVHVRTAILHSGQIIESDILETGRSVLERFRREYDADMKPSVSYLMAGVRSLYALLSFNRDVLKSTEAGSAVTAWNQETVNETWTALTRMSTVLTVFHPMVRPNSSLLPEMFADPVCSAAMTSLTLLTAALADEFANLSYSFAHPDNATAGRLIVEIGQSLGALDTVDNCTHQYKTVLADLDSWLKNLDFSDTNVTETKVDEILLTFIDVVEWLEELRDNYSTNVIRKLELANNLIGDSSVSALQRINNVILEIVQQVVTPMQNRIEVDENSASLAYYQLLKYFARMFSFTENDDIEKVARAMKIWRQPLHNLEIPETTTFQLNPDEVWQVWPLDEDLVTFVAESATSRLDLVCREYFDPLHRKLGDFVTETNNRHGVLVQAMTSLQRTLQQYKDSTDLDEAFALKNFLIIDIYYGELKYEYITQSESYTWVNFFSDMGSFFGLLMGCSILTMVEVIDLVIYYSAVKLIERYEERPLRQEVIDIKI